MFSEIKNLDAVIVATPNQLHEKHTVSFLKNKIPVLLEKPISDNINSAKKIFDGIYVYKNFYPDIDELEDLLENNYESQQYIKYLLIEALSTRTIEELKQINS